MCHSPNRNLPWRIRYMPVAGLIHSLAWIPKFRKIKPLGLLLPRFICKTKTKLLPTFVIREAHNSCWPKFVLWRNFNPMGEWRRLIKPCRLVMIMEYDGGFTAPIKRKKVDNWITACLIIYQQSKSALLTFMPSIGLPSCEFPRFSNSTVAGWASSRRCSSLWIWQENIQGNVFRYKSKIYWCLYWDPKKTES